MDASETVITRRIDMPPSIVWDCLIDDDLVSGWLAEASIEPVVGGRYNLHWQGGFSLADTTGRITELIARQVLCIETSNIGLVTIELAETRGGTRGRMTTITLTLRDHTDPRFTASSIAHWNCNFDQLEELVLGRPVDWATWEITYGPTWQRYLNEARSWRA
ncbi:MAG TPA: SRPBCC domain-containing protein [Glaciihabitans sp.]|nr:SRPBCC domain-containing protein [Glaciihabitans sp.]